MISKALLHSALILSVATLSGCTVHAPLMVELSDGTEELRGEAVASLAQGIFKVSNSQNLSCNGTYNQFTTTAKLKVDFKCSDQRTGTVEVMRYGEDLENGVGIGILSDGVKVRISIGKDIYARDVNKAFNQK